MKGKGRGGHKQTQKGEGQKGPACSLTVQFTGQRHPGGTLTTPDPRRPMFLLFHFYLVISELTNSFRSLQKTELTVLHPTAPDDGKHHELNQQPGLRDKLHLEIVFMYQKTNYCQVPPQ